MLMLVVEAVETFVKMVLVRVCFEMVFVEKNYVLNEFEVFCAVNVLWIMLRKKMRRVRKMKMEIEREKRKEEELQEGMERREEELKMV